MLTSWDCHNNSNYGNYGYNKEFEADICDTCLNCFVVSVVHGDGLDP